MTVQDRDNWPAYAGLVIGETGEYSRWLTTDGSSSHLPQQSSA